MPNSNWLPGEPTTLLHMFREALRKFGEEHQFLDYAGVKYNLGELDRESDRLARGLRASGVEAGHTVGAVLDTCVEQVLLLLATSKLGAVYVGINPANKGEFLRHTVAECAPAVILAEPDYAERVLQLEDKLPDLRVLLVRGDFAGRHRAARIEVRPLASAFSDSGGAVDREPLPTDAAMVIFTGGTTGPSKGCIVGQNYFCELAVTFPRTTGLLPTDTVWTPLPAFHFNQPANMWGTLMVGARFAVYPRFSVSNFWPEVERTETTVVLLLGTMLTMLADAPDNDAMLRHRGKLRVAAGVPFPLRAQAIWRERFGAQKLTWATYGLTECCPISYCSHLETVPPESCGRPNENFEVMIVDDLDRELPPGQPGEIVARPRKPYVMFDGYWGKPEATLKTLRNGWFHTGDIGRFDAEGFLYFVDRKKDYLRRRGENISASQLESIYRDHPDLVETAIHGVRAEHPEDEVMLSAVRRTGSSLTEEELTRWSIERMPYFAVPRFIEFLAELPRSPVGRIVKTELGRDLTAMQVWDREKSNIVVPKR